MDACAAAREVADEALSGLSGLTAVRLDLLRMNGCGFGSRPTRVGEARCCGAGGVEFRRPW